MGFGQGGKREGEDEKKQGTAGHCGWLLVRIEANSVGHSPGGGRELSRSGVPGGLRLRPEPGGIRGRGPDSSSGRAGAPRHRGNPCREGTPSAESLRGASGEWSARSPEG